MKYIIGIIKDSDFCGHSTGVDNYKEGNKQHDALDRLTAVCQGTDTLMNIKYGSNGNITSKTGVGNYYYNTNRRHAVIGVSNAGNAIPNEEQNIDYTDFGKIEHISEGANSMTFAYTPDEERFSSVLKYLNNIKRTVYYSDGYEEVSDDSLGNYSITYLGEDIIGVKRNNAVTYYYLLTDHQGSVLGIYDTTGSKVFDATYDAWGRQTVKKNDIGFLRGYTGHEMMPEFKLINMNGRLYDPLLGRFLSPDNYVQVPDFSQSLNRYTYCLNNPLKYTDPSGELFGLDDALVFSIVSGAMMGAFNAKVNGENAWKGAFLGAASGAASYGIGSAFGHSIGTFGHELLRAGVHGVAQGALSYANGGKFGTGFATGFASSLAGSGAQSLNFSNTGVIATTTVTGAATSAAFGGSWLDGAMIGFDIGYYNHGWTTKYGDLTYELDEVTVYGHRPRMFRNFPVEKPLRAVYPEFDILVGIKGLFSVGRELIHSLKVRCFNTTVTRSPYNSGAFFEGTYYSPKVNRSIDTDIYHSFPELVNRFENSGQIRTITGGDGIKRTMLRIPGSINGESGVYEYIKEPNGMINHRFFNVKR
jgi:RHS repeat-associated protein